MSGRGFLLRRCRRRHAEIEETEQEGSKVEIEQSKSLPTGAFLDAFIGTLLEDCMGRPVARSRQVRVHQTWPTSRFRTRLGSSKNRERYSTIALPTASRSLTPRLRKSCRVILNPSEYAAFCCALRPSLTDPIWSSASESALLRARSVSL